MPSSISNHTLKDFLHGGEPMKYESAVYVYGWIIEEHQSISFPQAEFAKEDIVHFSIDWNSKTSFFWRGGTNVGSQCSSSRRSRFNNKPDIFLGQPPDQPIEDQVLTVIDRPVYRPNTKGYKLLTVDHSIDWPNNRELDFTVGRLPGQLT